MIRLVASRPRAAKAIAEERAVDRAMINPLPTPPDGAASWSIDQAYAFCERIAHDHHENFPVASHLMPTALRRHVWALYAFARTADDFADEPRWEGRRREALDHWEEDLVRAFYGEAEHPIFIALRDTVERRDVPISPLRDLITAFRMDLTTRRYPTFEALRTYMQHSAAPIGQLLLYVFGYRDASLQRFADEISIALELTHFLQDLPGDLARDRIYLPAEDLHHFGVTEEELFAYRTTRGFRDLMRFEVARTRALFMRGRPLTQLVGRDLGFELSLIWESGMAILDKIEAQEGNVFRQQPVLDAADKVRMVLRGAAHRFER